MKRLISALCLVCFFATISFAQISDQQYINQLKYKNNRLQLVVKERKVNEQRNYSYTDIDTTTYSLEAYSFTNTDVSTDSLSRSEIKDITEWYVLKGGVRKLNDLEFLEIIGDLEMLSLAQSVADQKAGMRNTGNIMLGTGILIMLGGVAGSAGQAVVTGGGIAMAAGLFFNAFNQDPSHYIQPDYAQAKVDEYNILLKKELGLPINFE